MLKEYLAGGRSGSGAAAEGAAAGGQAAGVFLEVASGTGQHCAHFAAGLPQLTFQPTEYAEEDMSRCEQGMVGRRRRCAHACACAGWSKGMHAWPHASRCVMRAQRCGMPWDVLPCRRTVRRAMPRPADAMPAAPCHAMAS